MNIKTIQSLETKEAYFFGYALSFKVKLSFPYKKVASLLGKYLVDPDRGMIYCIVGYAGTKESMELTIQPHKSNWKASVIKKTDYIVISKISK